MLGKAPLIQCLTSLRMPMVRSSPSMTLRTSIRRLPGLLRGTVAIGLVLLLLAIAPFAVAQDVHHELAAADHDGHEHSDTDLCQWVTASHGWVLDIDAPLFTAQELVDLLELPADSVLLSFELSTPGPSRAPPASSHVISILTILARSSSDCLPAVAPF